MLYLCRLKLDTDRVKDNSHITILKKSTNYLESLSGTKKYSYAEI